jgi:hypothetical protein
MGLRQIAETDLGKILEDNTHGFGWSITMTNPAGTIVSGLIGYSNDISQIIDPDTGQAVSGRSASISIRIGLLTSNGLGLPVGISDATIKPWLVSFDDINGNTFTFKVLKSDPDRALGLVVCLLELYQL